jgi:hypothetical protein
MKVGRREPASGETLAIGVPEVWALFKPLKTGRFLTYECHLMPEPDPGIQPSTG